MREVERRRRTCPVNKTRRPSQPTGESRDDTYGVDLADGVVVDFRNIDV